MGFETVVEIRTVVEIEVGNMGFETVVGIE